MNPRYLETLEFNKVLQRLAEHTSFSASRALALALRPSTDAEQARLWQQETSEARVLLSVKPAASVGGAHDVRPLLKDAQIGTTLEPRSLLDVVSTLLSGKRLRRAIVHDADRFPVLATTARHIEECPKLVAEITRCINDQGEVVGNASPALARIRRQLIIARERLLDQLNRLITSPANARYLQEPLVTQRSGRYVIPLKAKFKGRVAGIIHDQSASGATLFIEPLVIVELGNKWRQLQLDETREVERILRELAAAVAAHGTEIAATVEALANLDLAFAKAEYACEIKAVEPVLWDQTRVDTTARDDGAEDAPYPQYLRVMRARHPMLPPETVVPIDVHLGGQFAILIVTGPNTGGKTVALKTIGLLAAMAQAGLQIPATEGSALRVFSGLYADIGDEQSIEQNLSTFSSHMTNIIDILATADSGSLVLLDELGAGTDPVEGSALARSILSELLRRRTPAMITTHHTELKLFAQTTPGVENAAVEFDLRTLSPTYKLTIGLPGRSRAFAIAKRLGLSGHIIDGARRLISAHDREADRILSRLHRSQKEISRATHAAKSVLASARRTEKGAHRRLRDIERERRDLLAEARIHLESAQDELSRARDTAERQKTTGPWLEEAAERLQRKGQELDSAEATLKPLVVEATSSSEHLAIGDTVWVSSLSQIGQVIGLANTEAEVQVGMFRAKVPISDLEKRPSPTPGAEAGSVHVGLSSRPMPSMELNLRGWRVGDALPHLDKYLDDAYLAALPYVRVIHGKGTGALRSAVRDALPDHALVASFRPGELGEGGDGVTIVTLVSKASG